MFESVIYVVGNRRFRHIHSVFLALYGVNRTEPEAMANALTAVRLLLVVPFALYMAQGDARSAIFALIAWAMALTTDFLDGPIARRRGTVTAWSGTFDHTSDFLFVTSGLFAGSLRGAFPWILPLLITVAFAQYVIDSYWIHRQTKLRWSKLGRYNGILYFVPSCMDILIRMGLRFLHPLLTILVWMLVLSTLISMGQRLMFRSLAEQLPSRPPEKY
jgi:CDP-diacylglycerol---glycerol-3-phosphate 3-phosphatidyltransferase